VFQWHIKGTYRQRYYLTATNVVDTSVREHLKNFFKHFTLNRLFLLLVHNIFSALSYVCAELFSNFTCPMIVLWKISVPSYATHLYKNQRI